jgi:hypothetical protein
MTRERNKYQEKNRDRSKRSRSRSRSRNRETHGGYRDGDGGSRQQVSYYGPTDSMPRGGHSDRGDRFNDRDTRWK